MRATPVARIVRLALAAAALVAALDGPAAAAAEPESPIVHDPVAAAELAAAMEALWALPSFRQSHQDLEPHTQPPRVIEHLGAGRMRILQDQQVGDWTGTTETVVRPARAAYRFVSADLDAHLATLKARERAATLVGIGSQVRQILQAAALGPAGVLTAVQGGLSLLGAGRGGLSGLADVDAYGKWHCIDLPELPVAGAGTGGAGSGAPADENQRVERLPDTVVDGEPVRGYRSETEAGGATLAYRTWVLAANGLPRRSEMSIEMPGFSSRSVIDFFDHGAVSASEAPPCLDGAGAAP